MMLIMCCAMTHAQDIRFKHLSFREGLAQSPISSIVKDSRGFVWLGNWKGLTRYDGYEFKTFNHNNADRKSISNNRVNSICEDRDHRLWIGTSNGLNRYDPVHESFTRFDIRNIKGGRNYIASVYQDSHHNIWAATFAGIKLVDTARKLLNDVSSFKSAARDNIFNGVTFTLFEDRDQVMWVGTRAGLSKFNPRTRQLVQLPDVIQQNRELMSSKVLVIRQDKRGFIWIGTESSGVFVFDPFAGKVNSFKHQDDKPESMLSNWVRDIYSYDDQHTWVGTRSGLSIYNHETGTFSNHVHSPLNPDGLDDSTIWSFMQDNASGIWVGTFAGGLNVFYPENANFSNISESIGDKIGLSHPVVNAITEDPDGGLWIGTYGGGINYLNRRTGKYQFYPIKDAANQSRNGVKSLADDGNGNLWVGTLDGLCVFNKKNKQIRFFKFNISQGKFSENLINAILIDSGHIWAGTNGGGLKQLLPDGSYRTFIHNSTDKNTLSDNFATSLLKGERGELWIGTQNGLNLMDRQNKQFLKFAKNAQPWSLNNNSILTLFKDDQARIWVGTDGGGLSYFDHKARKFYPLNLQRKLTDDVIHAIQDDRMGNLWLSTDNGLYKITFKRFAVPFRPSDLTITHYDGNDGLASNQFMTHAATRLQTGEMLFGGINGLTSFFPDRIIRNTVKPNVAFTDFLIRNRNVSTDSAGSAIQEAITFAKTVRLKYDEGYITIKFAALNFINAEKNQYAYKLDGLSNGEDWHYAGTQRTVSYANLEPGTYTFKVMASNNDGVWNKKPISLKIIVLPPWWLTWWAYAIYAATAVFIIYWIVQFFRNRARLKRELYLEHLQNERQEELHQMKIDFFTNISHEIRTPLTLIVGPLEKMIGAAAAYPPFLKQLEQVQQNAFRLMRLVTELMDFRKSEDGQMKLSYALCDLIKFSKEIFLSFQNLADESRITYTFQSASEESYIYFDKDHFEKVIFNLLANAFKFTPEGGKISFLIEDTEKEIKIAIADNGKGIAAEHIPRLFNRFYQVSDKHANQGYGIGLALSKSIVELHQGKIDVQSKLATMQTPGATVFTVSLLKGDAHLDPKQLIPEYMNSDNPDHYYLQSQAGELIGQTDVVNATTGLKLLIIEDNTELRTFIKSAFLDQYEISEAANGVAGLKMILLQMPDLVISDVMMPEMDGLELCRRIKSDERINHIPVILLTARAAYIHQVNGLEKGADAYITKPFSIQVLELNVRNVLATRLALKKRFTREVLLNPQQIENPGTDEKFLQKLMAIIDSELDNPDFDVSMIVEKIGMSKTVLYKKVNALVNISIADLIKTVRLKKAALLLETNQISIAEVAFSVGFNDRKYFSKEFKKLFNMSPSEYIASKA